MLLVLYALLATNLFGLAVVLCSGLRFHFRNPVVLLRQPIRMVFPSRCTYDAHFPI